ncbi:hypothetical protein M2333_000948 [Sphingobium sp. B11D3B]|nr:hypothetical protein [Sphingobium sp. B11D3D]MCW2387902.1 hypothetical protein [Sphingobium sp. B11D3B]MCW2394431.1 hypothetical protein [Sphingobium sp. B8D3B]MCW2417945.1 hypothetical protein [Sphingobium sp. B8D3C]
MDDAAGTAAQVVLSPKPFRALCSGQEVLFWTAKASG